MCVGTSPVGPRVSVEVHLHVIETLEDCRGLLHPPSGSSQRRACRCGAVNVPVSSYCHVDAPGLGVAAGGSHRDVPGLGVAAGNPQNLSAIRVCRSAFPERVIPKCVCAACVFVCVYATFWVYGLPLDWTHVLGFRVGYCLLS